jgi:lipopolysaccharide transport system permease protein
MTEPSAGAAWRPLLQRELDTLRHFAAADLRQRFHGNLAGLGWALLAPLIQLAVFAFVFVVVFKARMPGMDGSAYVAYLALGMWPWFAFTEALVRGGSALNDNVALLNKVAMPTHALVLGRVFAAFLVHGGGFLAVLVALSLYGLPIDWSGLPLALAGWLLFLLFAIPFALMVAALSVFVRDTQQVLPFLLSALMFLSPVFYAFDQVPEAARAVLSANPLAVLVVLVRDALFATPTSFSGSPLALPLALLGALVAFVIYRRLAPHLQDFL